ncbi:MULTISPECIES: plasmid mobilization relaxosome protein MobC [Acinetobacter]|uniref:plasmid mobilization relaxosome protein MobC n=1 Tax=Acinetobacter TaxID=469 RepID=UPI001372FF63|nr:MULTISPECIES: plasmid mobilization relaxosome protein MobC [Acinetobacter]MBJ8552045.1 plasmid mobilization relaxosome protein MobC [Acinetobacter bereziniae]MDM1782911.1 plasmid mobilization relaxosome protein MobC [Acinetobacter bereziniae]NAR29689.1 plasmid mobilization relaxosome protein MobC [Acinetobacter haemolyticus]
MVSSNFVNKSKRLSRLELRLNDLELDLIKKSAKILNKTTSDFIRFSVNHYIQNILNVDQSAIRESHVVAKQVSHRGVEEDSKSIAFQLAKIGNNLNQITRAIHISNKIGKPIDLLRTYLLVEDYLKKIYQLYPLPCAPSLHRSDETVQRRHQHIEQKYLADLLRQMQVVGGAELESVSDADLSEDHIEI